jgi:hypothetical protein
MKSLLKNRAMRIAVFFSAWVVSVSGCRPQPPEDPAPFFGSTTLGKGTVLYWHFKGRNEGAQGRQSVVICCDITGNLGVMGSSSGYQLTSTDGKRCLNLQTERTEDGNVKVRLDGKEYDASKGILFLVKVEGDKTEVEQLAKDLPAFQTDSRSIEQLVRKDAAASKLLGIKAD